MTDKLSPDIKFQLVRKIECHKVIGLAGFELLEHEAKYLEFHRLPGVILFQRNIDSLPQVRELLESVDERLGRDGLPPIVMADHEGDFVSELQRVIGIPPSVMAIAATRDTALARQVARETGEAMAKLGVNVVLAPNADLYLESASPVTGLRTFGRDPAVVAEFVAETIGGFHEAGLLTCVKHFPGHGSTGEDSHETLPEVRRSIDELRGSDLIPFQRAIDEGVDMVMTAHVTYAGEADTARPPASFDSRFLRDELRDRMGFEGVVITDALEMEGAREHARATYGGLTGGFERALLAGSDLLLYASFVPERMSVQEGDPPMIAVEVMQTIIDTLERVVDRERIDRKLVAAAESNEGIRNLLSILNVSEARVSAMRKRLRELREPPDADVSGNVIQFDRFASPPAIYKTVAKRSIALVRDPESFIPLGTGARCILMPIATEVSRFLKAQAVPLFLDGLCRKLEAWESTRPVSGFGRGPEGVLEPVFVPRTTPAVVNEGASPARKERSDLPEEAVVIPVLSFRGLPSEAMRQELSDFIEQRGVPLVIVTGWPAVDWIPEQTGVLLTFGASPQVAAATAGVLAGELTPLDDWDITS